MAVFFALAQFHAFILIQERVTLNWQLGRKELYIQHNKCAVLNLPQLLCIVALQCLGACIIINNSNSCCTVPELWESNMRYRALTAHSLSLSPQWMAAGPCGRSGRRVMCRVGGVSRSDLEPVPTQRLWTAALSARACLYRKLPAMPFAQVSPSWVLLV